MAKYRIVDRFIGKESRYVVQKKEFLWGWSDVIDHYEDSDACYGQPPQPRYTSYSLLSAAIDKVSELRMHPDSDRIVWSD